MILLFLISSILHIKLNHAYMASTFNTFQKINYMYTPTRGLYHTEVHLVPPFSISSQKKGSISATKSPTTESESTNFRRSYTALFGMLLIFASNQWTREAIAHFCDFSSVVDPFKHMNVDLSFDKEMYSTLESLSFTLIYAVASLFAGGIVDNYDRREILSWACLIWGYAISFESMMNDFNQFIPFYIIVAISQAFFTPAAYTLISDIFPSQIVGRMNGILSGGVYIGGAVASKSMSFFNKNGWRATLYSIGRINYVTLGPLINIFSKESSKKSNPNSDDSTYYSSIFTKLDRDEINLLISKWVEKVQFILSNDESRLILLASIFRYCAGFSTGVWMSPYILTKFPSESVGLTGINLAIVCISSNILGGYISDIISKGSTSSNISAENTSSFEKSVTDLKSLASPSSSSSSSSLSSSGIPRARIWVAAVGSLLAAPTWIGFIQATTPYEATEWLLAEYLVAECWIGPTLAALFESVGKDKRGSAQGVFSLLTALGNFAPILVGYVSSQLSTAGTSDGLGQALMYVVSSAYLISGLLFGAAAMKRDKIIQEAYMKST